MTTLPKSHPELFENETLGEAVTNRFLDEVELQEAENRSANAEGREPLIAQREVRYPTMTPSGSVPSSVADVVNLVEPGSGNTNESSGVGEDNPYSFGD